MGFYRENLASGKRAGGKGRPGIARQKLQRELRRHPESGRARIACRVNGDIGRQQREPNEATAMKRIELRGST